MNEKLSKTSNPCWKCAGIKPISTLSLAVEYANDTKPLE